MKQAMKLVVSIACAVLGAASAWAYDYNDIPFAYEPVKMLISSGAQYINTGFAPNASTSVKMEFNTGTYVHDTAFFGTGWAKSRYLLMQGSSKYRFFGNDDNTQVTAVDDKDASLTVGGSSLTLVIDGVTNTTAVTVSSNGGTLYIFSCGAEHYCTFGLKSFEISQGGSVVHYYLPAVRRFDSKPGLYDCVTGDFRTNQGTGVDFTYEPLNVSRMTVALSTDTVEFNPSAQTLPSVTVTDTETGDLLSEGSDYEVVFSNTNSVGIATATVNGLGSYAGESTARPFKLVSDTMMPIGYTQLEYIQSTGTQYINTETFVNGRMRFEADFAFDDASTVQQRVFGVQDDDNKYLTLTSYINGKQQHAWACKNGTGQWTSTSVAASTSRRYLVIDGGAGTVAMTNVASGAREYYATPFSGVAHSNKSRHPMVIFATILQAGTISNYGKLKLYSVKISESGVPVANFVPCRRESDGTVGVYDRVNCRFLGNSGTGSFTAGPAISPLQVAADIPDQAIVGGVPVTPAVTVINIFSGETMTEGVDYAISYTNNAVPGTAQVVITGLGAYAGVVSVKDFTAYDGGPATPYPNLSRSYVPGGLVGFWDAIDNAGTGTHDPVAAVWKDLSGYGFDGTMNGIATWANGNAMHNEADGYPCILPEAFTSRLTWHTATWEFAFQPTELDTTRVVFSNYKSSNYGMIISHNNGTTFADGAIRHYRRNGSVTGDIKLDSKVKANELAYFTIADEVKYIQAWRDSNTASFYSSGQNAQQNTANPFIIGGRDANPTHAMRGDIRFLRAYNRLLTAKERAFNRALDRIRHENRSFRFSLPAELPDGYEYDSARDVLRIRVNASAIGAQGLVSVNGATPVKFASAWFDVGAAVTLSYSGDGFLGWTNLPSAYTYPNSPNQGVVSFTAGAPTFIVARSSAAANESAITAYSYVQKGLLSLFDGIDNTGTGLHEASSSTAWVDLTGSGRKWTRRNSGSWGANCLTLSSANKDSAYTA